MRGKQTARPYQPLGQKLRALRTRAKESLSETSGAVEVDVAQLANFESGHARPSEETLLLLISHFEPQDTDALSLWKLAGYDLKGVDIADEIVGEDTVAAYTDFMEVSANQHGLILDFKQTSLSGELKTVAKLGLSREHAQSIVQALMMALVKTSGNQQRLLPPSQADDNSLKD